MNATLQQQEPIVASVAPDTIADSQPAAVSPLAPAARSRITVPFSGSLRMDSRFFEFDPRDTSDSSLLSRCQFFESVHIEECSITGHMLSGSSRWLAAAITDKTLTNTTSIEELLKSPVANFTQGAQYGGTNLTIALPPSHPFGREIKGVNLGNKSPKFYLHYGGGTDTATTKDVFIRGTITISWSGTAPVSGF